MKTEDKTEATPPKKRLYICDCCGGEMIEKSCKVTCPNRGSRYDCSDLTIHLD